ncbi:MAG: hypothetical protein OEZ06_11275 [Myxococcales bacterium]|nr:hypothetical protein [Myxococcales bacterium]
MDRLRAQCLGFLRACGAGSFLGALAAGCVGDASCDPGMELVNYHCEPVADAVDAGDDAATTRDAAVSDSGPPQAPDGGASEDAGARLADPECASDGAYPGGFGRPCSDAQTHAECDCATDYCAIQLGQSQGVCTASGCLEDPSVCPDGYSCLDLSNFQAGLPAICSAL